MEVLRTEKSEESIGFDISAIRADFPILRRAINGKPLAYLDNAATSQKPRQVLKALLEYYMQSNANVQRGIHKLAEEATEKYEEARAKIASFINAKPEEIIFVRNATEAINLVAYSLGSEFKRGDQIISTVMEHHSNIVPWQAMRPRGVKLDFVDIHDKGALRLTDFDTLLSARTGLVTLTHVSNVLGTINPVEKIVRKAHRAGSLVLVDGAQSVPHMPVDVKRMGCDFLAFSGHKMCGPTGIGVLYGRRELLEEMRPFLYGGDMIREVSLERTTYNDLPWKFEAGTPNIADAIALGAAVDYLSSIGMHDIRRHEVELTAYALERLSAIKGVEIYGPMDTTIRGGVVSFNVKGVHAHDVATILDHDGIAIRSGHACAQPLAKRLGVSSIARASFYLYNTLEEVDRLAAALQKVRRVFRLA